MYSINYYGNQSVNDPLQNLLASSALNEALINAVPPAKVLPGNNKVIITGKDIVASGNILRTYTCLASALQDEIDTPSNIIKALRDYYGAVQGQKIPGNLPNGTTFKFTLTYQGSTPSDGSNYSIVVPGDMWSRSNPLVVYGNYGVPYVNNVYLVVLQQKAAGDSQDIISIFSTS